VRNLPPTRKQIGREMNTAIPREGEEKRRGAGQWVIKELSAYAGFVFLIMG
jgi:hypothetical protein